MLKICTIVSYFSTPKHPIKVHVWAGISMRGRTGVCVFDGIMDADGYTEILRSTLLPLLRDVYCISSNSSRPSNRPHPRINCGCLE